MLDCFHPTMVRRTLRPLAGGALLALLFVAIAPAAQPDRARQLSLAALERADAQWDERAALLWTSTRPDGARGHGVRPTAWYALGLLLRDGPGDQERAVRAIEAVLRHQIHEPGQPWHGTFFRRAEEPRPLARAKMWDDYDPNWRQFIGCVFAQALLHYEDRLPADLPDRLEQAIARALEGEQAHGRLRPHYTNIALMHGFLLGFAGERLARAGWTTEAEEWVGEIHREFEAHQSFDEYNSPTYYGVDLYGLALLREHGATAGLRTAGATMEAALWQDIARFYHAGLHNLAGPFDRSYGMDLRRYVALVGVWMGFVLPEAQTPLPDLRRPARHTNDFLFTPCFALLGAQVPDDVIPHLRAFQGERQVRRPIADGRRVATAWLADTVMIGAESTAWSRGVPQPNSQFHPATVHWQLPGGDVGWLALRECSRVNATAAPHQLTIEAIGPATFRIHAPGLASEAVTRDRWSLPGLLIDVSTDAIAWSSRRDGDAVEITYTDATRFDLRLTP